MKEENLNEEEIKKFINNSFRDGQVKTNGTDIEKILPPMRRFGGGNKAEKKQTIIEKVLKFFEKYFGLNIHNSDENFTYNISEYEEEELLQVADAEPDLEFYLSPKQDLRNNPNLVYVKEGYEIADVTMDLKINLWDEKGTLTSNYIFTTFDRKEIEAFYYYLCLITNVLDKEDDNIKKLIKNRTIEE